MQSDKVSWFYLNDFFQACSKLTFYCNLYAYLILCQASKMELQKQPSEVFLRTGVLKICSKFTGEHLSRSLISIKLLCSFIVIALWRRCSPVNIFRTPFLKSASRWLFLELFSKIMNGFLKSSYSCFLWKIIIYCNKLHCVISDFPVYSDNCTTTRSQYARTQNFPKN